MNKLHKWLGVATALLFSAPAIQAQNNYYQFGGNFDHGVGREVIQSIDPGNPGGYVVVGTANTPMPGNIPMVMVSEYTVGGLPFWTGMYPINNGMPAPNFTADGMSIAAAPPANLYGVVAYTDFTAPAQSVLFEIGFGGGLTGVWTSLGDLRATSVIFDPNINAFLVLGQSPNNNGDLQLIAVAVGGGVIFSQEYDSGPGFRDMPARLMLDPWTNDYVLVGSSYDTGINDMNVFVVRVGNGTAGFPLICSETIGDPLLFEVGVDVTWGIDAAGVKKNIVLAYSRSNRITPIVIDMDPTLCPGYVSSTALIPTTTWYNVPTGIVTDPNTLNYCISGRNFDMDANGFIAVINNAYAPVSYSRLGQPGAFPGDEGLNDIFFDPATNQLVNTGDHQRLVPWGGSPANQFYVWLPMTNPLGMNLCPDPQPMITKPLCPLVVPYNLRNPFYNPTPVNVFQFFVPSIFLDECLNPFRLADDKGKTIPGSATVFPNPASDNIMVAYNVAPTDQPVLEVTNMVGEVVLTRNLTPTEKSGEIDVKSLAPGMYIMRIRNGDVDLVNEKITIQR